MNLVEHVVNPTIEIGRIKWLFVGKIEKEIYRATLKNKYVISIWPSRATLIIVARSRKYKIWTSKKGNKQKQVTDKERRNLQFSDLL